MLGWPVGVQYLAMPAGSALALVFVLHETALVAAGRLPGSEGEPAVPLPAE